MERIRTIRDEEQDDIKVFTRKIKYQKKNTSSVTKYRSLTKKTGRGVFYI